MSDGSEKNEKDTEEAEEAVEGDDEALTTEEIVALLSHIGGVGPKTAEKLAEAGYDSIEKVSQAEKEKLAEAVTGLSVAKAEAVILEALDLLEKIESGAVDLSGKSKSKRKKAPEPEPERHELTPIAEIERAEERKNLVTGYDEDKAKIGITIGPKWLTKYEKARIIGARALQISMGAPVMIDVSNIQNVGRFGFAEEELRSGILPMTVRRTLPTGEYSDIPLSVLLKHTRLD
ncbi:MAG: DNA-directed RNA polymerase subunit K [Candidatus Thorarchaeota archaeon]|nr:DNA-directed RNA polymerase subunit K [Candidatus Thorarchaeota archaeon]